MALNTGSGGSPTAEMNVTPLIDVLLVLLIIFMIITPTAPNGLQAYLPQQHGKESNGDLSIVLQLLANPTDERPDLAINQQKLGWPELQKRLIDIYKSRADGVLFIKSDSNVNFEYVAEIIDSARAVKINRVALMP
jgi:biopolymer transport protein ExbD